jgi:hypothetical protein
MPARFEGGVPGTKNRWVGCERLVAVGWILRFDRGLHGGF